MIDSAVIEKCQNGDSESFRYLVEGYQKQAAGHAIAILRDREDASDAVQDAFVDAYRSIKKFDNTRPFYPWFYVLLRNRCYKITSKRGDAENVEDIEILAPQSGLPGEERYALERALHSLSRKDREIITLKYLDGLSYQELADYLQIPKGTVMSRLFYARRQLRSKLSGNVG